MRRVAGGRVPILGITGGCVARLSGSDTPGMLQDAAARMVEWGGVVLPAGHGKRRTEPGGHAGTRPLRAQPAAGPPRRRRRAKLLGRRHRQSHLGGEKRAGDGSVELIPRTIGCDADRDGRLRV
jgi:hypothetical protein